MNTNIQLGIDQAIEALYKFSGQSDKMIKYNEDGRECESCMGYISCLDWMQDGLKAKRDSCKGWYYANKTQVEGLLTDWDYRRGKIKPKCKDDKNMKKQCSNCKWGEDEHSPCMMDGAIICEQPNVHLWEPIEQQTKYDPKARYYDAGGIETLDVIEAKLTVEQYKGFCLGNAMKYICRAEHKGNFKRDMEKAIFYLKQAQEGDK